VELSSKALVVPPQFFPSTDRGELTVQEFIEHQREELLIEAIDTERGVYEYARNFKLNVLLVKTIL
jgi:hypothetical protein